MKTQRDLHRLILVFIIAVALASVVTQNVSATAFFDNVVTLRSKANPALLTFVGQHPERKGEQVSVLIVFSQILTTEQLQSLESLGNIRSFTGHVATMSIRQDLLPQVGALDFVERVSLPRNLKSQLDVSVPEILANQVWSTVDDSAGNPVLGTGSIVGVVDSGIDYLHKDFYFPNGTNKVLYIWDQSVQGNPPTAFNYGNECAPSAIQSKTCEETDDGSNGLEVGHGTAVAAVAASSGQAIDHFASCLRFDSATWFNDTSLCQSSGDRQVLGSSSDALYVGDHQRFDKINFEFATPGDYNGLVWEYSKGSGSWAPLVNDTVTISLHNQTEKLTYAAIDGTSGFSHNGTLVFAPTNDWKPDTVNGVAGMYWIRVLATKVNKPAVAYRVDETPPYYGVAPGASIIAVKLKDGAEDHVLDGINYIVNKARELGRPLVIDHSLGDSLGSHDGTEPLEMALTDITQDGVPIVVSAGNSANLNLHARGNVTQGQSVPVSWTVDESQGQSYIDLWYSASDSISLSVKTPSGINVAGPTSETGLNTPDGNILILPGAFPTGNEWYIAISSPSGRALQTTPWSFTLGGTRITNGTWDAWVEPGQFAESMNGLYTIDPQDTIDSPGTARGVITVGSYMTRFYWRSGCESCIEQSVAQGKHGIWWTETEAPGVGALAYSSSMGPTRDGRIKPEITAPGSQIVTARASARDQRASDPDNAHQVWRGTSFAAAHVTGVIALMLQKNPYLSPDEIKSILTQDARQDQFTGVIDKQIGSPLWGWGKVNALASTRDAPTLYSVKLEILPVPTNALGNLILDGRPYSNIPLNDSRTMIFEFRREGSLVHSIELNPTVIQTGSGTRYVLSGSPWKFSSGGLRVLDYEPQYFLQVTSQYGNATGTGWYYANSTALVSVFPTTIPGYTFHDWSGSASSTSPTVEITMNSEKQLTAQWQASAAGGNSSIDLPIVLAVVVVIAVMFLAFRRRASRRIRLRPVEP